MDDRDRRILVPEAEEAMDELKEQVARDTGLDDDIRERGWENMTTREVGKIGGHMVKRMIRQAENNLRKK